jgi:NAD-dependent DNA ligase
MNSAITDIPGIGPAAAKTLMENGFKSLREIADTTIDKLAAVPGFGSIRAGRVIKAANEVLSNAADAVAEADKPATTRSRVAAKPATTTATSNETEADTTAKEVPKKEQEKLKKAKKAAAKKAKKAKKAAEKKAKAKKAAARKAKSKSKSKKKK